MCCILLILLILYFTTHSLRPQPGHLLWTPLYGECSHLAAWGWRRGRSGCIWKIYNQVKRNTKNILLRFKKKTFFFVGIAHQGQCTSWTWRSEQCPQYLLLSAFPVGHAYERKRMSTWLGRCSPWGRPPGSSSAPPPGSSSCSLAPTVLSGQCSAVRGPSAVKVASVKYRYLQSVQCSVQCSLCSAVFSVQCAAQCSTI